MESEQNANPRTADDGEAVSGFPEPPGRDPGDVSGDEDPHHSLNNPVGEPDPDRDDLLEEEADADRGEPPERDNLDD